MKKGSRKIFVVIAALAVCRPVGFDWTASAQEQFKKLSGSEIRVRFSGMEFTDQVHWGEIYESNGNLASEEMGTKRRGAWRVRNDELCTDYGKDIGSICYEVWMSGKNVQLRTKNSSDVPLEGVLEKPRK